MRAALVVIALLVASVSVENVRAQNGSVPRIPLQPQPVIVEKHVDSNYYAIPPADSARMFDSIYKLRRAEIDERERLGIGKAPQDAFFTLYATVSALNEMKAHDLNEYFAERSGRSDPVTDANTTSGIDRYITLGGEFHLSNTIAVAIEYDFIARYFNTVADSITPGAEVEEDLDMTYHVLLVGPEVTLFSSHLLNLKARGGIGPVLAIGGETEALTGVSRSSSAAGLAVSFDLATDLRFIDWASFTVDLFARSISTGALTTSDNHDLSAPFGFHKTNFTLAPNANTSMFGLAIGGVIYF